MLSVLTLFVDIKGYKKDAYYQIDCASRNFRFLILLIGYALLRASEIRLYDPSLTPALYAYIDRLQYVSIKKKNTVLIANCTMNAAMSFFEDTIVIFAGNGAPLDLCWSANVGSVAKWSTNGN